MRKRDPGHSSRVTGKRNPLIFYIFSVMKNLVHDRKVCLACAGCVGLCPKMALDMYGLDLQIDSEKCIKCGICVKACPVGALKITEVSDA